MNYFEIEDICKKINNYEFYVDALRVKQFYLNFKKEETEYEENENKIKIVNLNERIQFFQLKLNDLNTELQNLMIKI